MEPPILRVIRDDADDLLETTCPDHKVRHEPALRWTFPFGAAESGLDRAPDKAS
jgi:hypothetical protein